MHDSRVVLIADDTGFARDLITPWKTERGLPAITAMSTDELSGIAEGTFDLAIVGPVHHKRLSSVLKLVDIGDRSAICVLENPRDVKILKTERPRLLAIHQHPGWVDAVLLLAAECLKRLDLMARLRRAEQAALAGSRGAALGRYMMESRHDINNSLTSVLGNAELLLLDAGTLPEPARDQLQTIHEMALHMHQIMQRFSSSEMRAVEKSSQGETDKLSHEGIAAL